MIQNEELDYQKEKIIGKKNIKMKNKKAKIKKVIKGLSKASKTHAAQAKTLKSVIGNGKKKRSQSRHR